jgi:uncharacterized protein
LRIVLDTNVLVSGLLTPHGPPGRMVDLLLAGEVTLIYDDRILSEDREVLERPRFDFDPGAVEDVLELFATEGEAVTAPPLAVELPDPDDLPFVEVAAAGRADALVTGNLRHYPEAVLPAGVRVVAVADFVREWSRW